MARCTNKFTVYRERGFRHIEVEIQCGSTNPYGEPDYCNSCRERNSRMGYAPHQCRHGKNLSSDDGQDIVCIACEMGE